MRVRPVGLGELLCRGRQGGSKWLERWRHEARPSGARDAAGVDAQSRERFCATMRSRFFPGAWSDQTPNLVATRMPAASAAVLAAADKACRGRFDLLGYRDLTFGDPVDWHLDPVLDRRAPRVHWSRIDPLAPAQVGDSKVVWELNRHQWLVTLGQAWRLTRDERYADTFARSVRAWIDANPHGIGINWASSLEVALRIVSWSWALSLFRDAAALTPRLLGEMRSSLATHARHVERYLSYYFSPNTHLTGEALGLCYAAAVLPAARRAPRWRATGIRILGEQMERQSLADGVYFEQSTCYQRYTIEIGLHFLILARRCGWPVPAGFAERLTSLLDFLLAARAPDGSLPAIGDADGGWIMPLEARAPGDARGVFAVAAALEARADYAWAAGPEASEVAWLLGKEGQAAFDRLTPAPPAREPSSVFPAGGYAICKGGWKAEDHQLILDAGPLGGTTSAGHGHADLLAIQVWSFGEAVIVDPGTGSYTADADVRRHFRSSRAHSTVGVDGRDQAEPAGPFAWRSRPSARLMAWRSNAEYDLAEAEHDAYSADGETITHRRRVAFLKVPGLFVVFDEVTGERDHRVEVRFQFAPLHVSELPTGWVRACGRAGRGLLLRCFSDAPLSYSLSVGEEDPSAGWFSAAYGSRVPAPALAVAAAGRSVRVVSLLLPVADAGGAPPLARPLFGPDVAGFAIPGKASVEFGKEGLRVAG